MNMRTAALLTTVAAVLAMTGCGGNATPSGASAPSAASPQPAPSPPAPTFKTLDQQALTSALLPLKAMPTGYSDDPSEKDRSTDKTFCNYKPQYNPTIKVSKSYIKGGGLSVQLIYVSLRQYATPEQAKASFEQMAKTLETCRKDTLDGNTATYALMNLPETGERSLGVRIETEGATVLQSFALIGPTLVTAGTGGMMSADADIVHSLLSKQVDQYSAAAKA